VIEILNKFSYYFLFAAIVSLPFSYSLSSIFIGLLLIVNLSNPAYYRYAVLPNIKTTEGQVFYLSLLFFFYHFVGFIKSYDIPGASLNIQIKLPFLIFPFLFLYKNRIIKTHLKYTLFAFVIGSTLNVLFMITGALYRSLFWYQHKFVFYSWYFPRKYNQSISELLQNGASEFTYSQLAHFFHPAYIAMYLILSIAILFYFLKSIEFKHRFLRFISNYSS
jgi:hypothetical protein